jgi:hypothetical protein
MDKISKFSQRVSRICSEKPENFAYYPTRPRSCWPHGHTAYGAHEGLHGLIMEGIAWQSSSCGKLACMIDADHMVTSHVSGSCRFGLVFDGGVNLHGVVRRSRDVHCGTARVWCASRTMY